MKQSRKSQFKTGAAAIALAAGMFAAAPALVDFASAPAWAQGQGQGGQGGQGGRGGSAAGGAPEGRGHGQPTTTGAPAGRGGEAGQRGPSADSDGTPHRGQPLPGTRGGRPVWAGDGAIPEVELGRLNVSRAPVRVLESRYAELVANWATMGVTQVTFGGVTYTVAQIYSMSAAQFAALLAAYYDSFVRFDSPLENLALLRVIYLAPSTMLTGITPYSNSDLAAIAIGSASDKTIPISINTVVALNTILGLNIPADQIPYVATQAELVRQAIVSGHG